MARTSIKNIRNADLRIKMWGLILSKNVSYYSFLQNVTLVCTFT